MTDDLDRVLSLGEKFLIDFSAVLRLYTDGRSDLFFNSLFDANKQIVINGAFRVYHDIVRKQADSKEKTISGSITQMLERFRREGRLTEHADLSWESFIREYSDDRFACLILLEHSFSIERIRDMEMPARFAVCIVGTDGFRPYSDLRTFLSTELSYSVHPISQSTDYLDAVFHCNVGDKVYDSEGAPILLTEKISTGAEGIVFRTEEPQWVAKIYHRGVITPLRWRKLMHMTQKGISADGICWPNKLLYTFNKIPVGFLMQTAAGYTLGSVFDGPDAIISRFPEWARLDVVRVALRVLEKVMYLHIHGVLIGDIQMKNMMMKDPENIYVIDMDSVQIEDMPCPVGTEEYTSPELWDFSFSDVLRRPIHEDFSCAILVFSILFCGQHPYAQRFGRETLREEIIEKSFPYVTEADQESLVPIGGYDKIWGALTEKLRKMFFEAFRNGKRFEPVEWYEAAREYQKDLTEGSYQDMEAYRLFPHTDLTVREDNSGKPKTYKKTIREAIMNARADVAIADYSGKPNGSDPDKPLKMSSGENMLYNGQRTQPESQTPDEGTFSKGVISPDRGTSARIVQEHAVSNDAAKSSGAKSSDIRVKDRKRSPKSIIQTIKEFCKRNKTLLLLGLILLISIVLMIVISMVYD